MCAWVQGAHWGSTEDPLGILGGSDAKTRDPHEKVVFSLGFRGDPPVELYRYIIFNKGN